MNCKLPRNIIESSPSIYRLFQTAALGQIVGRNTSSTSTVSISSAPDGYYISLSQGYFSFYKKSSSTLTRIYQQSASYGNLRLSSTTLYYSNTGSSSTSVYGATIAQIIFNYPDKVVEALLTNLTVNGNVGRNESTTGSTGLDASVCQTADIVVVSKDNTLTFYKGSSVTSPEDLIALCSTDTRAGEYNTSNDRLRVKNSYGFSVIAFNYQKS